YYIADSANHPPRSIPEPAIHEYDAPDSSNAIYLPMMDEGDVAQFFSNSAMWESPSPTEPSPFDQRRKVKFTMKADQFFVLCDNSPASSDGGLWGQNRHFVERRLLLGKALFIYWPHSFNRVSGTNIPFPYFPNFSRMRFIR